MLGYHCLKMKIPNMRLSKNFKFLKANSLIESVIAIKVNNQLYKLREKEEVVGITIKKTLNDSIVLVFNGKEKIIKKQH